MDEPTTLHDFAERYSMEVGDVMLAVIKYLVNDPQLIHPHIRQVLSTATDQDIEEALETIADDLKSTGRKEAIQ